jgi:hypothetical protein
VLAVVRDGQPLNLATVHKGAEEPSSWDVSLPLVHVRDLDVVIDRNGRLEHLDDLAIDASARLPAAGPIAAKLGLTGIARERDRAPIAISAEVWNDERGVVVPVAHLGHGDVTEGWDELDAGHLHWAAGAGLRVSTLVGAIRADLAYRLTRSGPGEPRAGEHFAYHLGIGEAF